MHIGSNARVVWFAQTGLAGGQGVDADVIFFAFMAQYTHRVAGFGGNAGSDEFGRPIALLMSCEEPNGAAQSITTQDGQRAEGQDRGEGGGSEVCRGAKMAPMCR